ncbi:MAG: GAF domain-containing protein [Elusimicrobiota bacterium]|nr:GAF domain-containing protein [Elusimicrobiota bacterium]
MKKKIKSSDREKKELYEWKRRLSLILDYSSKIKADSSLKETLSLIADAAKDVLESDRCTVFLLDEETDELFSWVAHGMGSKKLRFPSDKGLAGHVATAKETLNIKDAYSDDRFNPEIDKKTGYRTETILCMPMTDTNGRVIGVFQVLNKKEGTFNRQDEEVLSLLAREAASAIENAMLYKEMKKSFESFINTLAETIDARDPMTAGHSKRVCGYSLLIAEKLGYSPEKMDALKYAALLHDLGKIGVKEAVLTKPGKLDDSEYKHIQSHAVLTGRILERTYFQKAFRGIPLAASSHHENLDGSGYPRHIKGKDIPETSRIMAVADVFDALTYKRHYRQPMPFAKVINILKEDSGSKFDSAILEVFLNLPLDSVLNVMLKDGSDEEIFKSLTVDEICRKLENGADDEAVKAFRRCYPPQSDSEE